MPHDLKSRRIAGIICGFLHNEGVTVGLDRPRDAGYQVLVRAPTDVPVGAPLLKVYDYGPLRAAFFEAARRTAITGGLLTTGAGPSRIRHNADGKTSSIAEL